MIPRRQNPANVSPWKLTPREAQAMDAYVQHGPDLDAVAAAFVGKKNTVAGYLQRCMTRIKAGTRVECAQAWRQWRANKP